MLKDSHLLSNVPIDLCILVDRHCRYSSIHVEARGGPLSDLTFLYIILFALLPLSASHPSPAASISPIPLYNCFSIFPLSPSHCFHWQCTTLIVPLLPLSLLSVPPPSFTQKSSAQHLLVHLKQVLDLTNPRP